MSILRALAGMFGGLFLLFGHLWSATAQILRPVLEAFGFVHPQPQDIAGDAAEGALEQVRAQRSTLDRDTGQNWSLQKKMECVVSWSDWKLRGKTGPEPSLIGLTLRERMTLKQAREDELKSLKLRYRSEVIDWLSGHSSRLMPLTDAQGALRRVQTEIAQEAIAGNSSKLAHQEHKIVEMRKRIAETDSLIIKGWQKVAATPADAPAPRARFA